MRIPCFQFPRPTPEYLRALASSLRFSCTAPLGPRSMAHSPPSPRESHEAIHNVSKSRAVSHIPSLVIAGLNKEQVGVVPRPLPLAPNYRKTQPFPRIPVLVPKRGDIRPRSRCSIAGRRTRLADIAAGPQAHRLRAPGPAASLPEKAQVVRRSFQAPGLGGDVRRLSGGGNTTPEAWMIRPLFPTSFGRGTIVSLWKGKARCRGEKYFSTSIGKRM